MLRLRMSDGLSISEVSERFGASTARVVEERARQHVAGGTVEMQGDRLVLADPEGLLVSNSIISDLFAALDEAL